LPIAIDEHAHACRENVIALSGRVHDLQEDAVAIRSRACG
jgi:hypothetical protein